MTAGELYSEDVRKIIQKTVWNFVKFYRETRHLDELFSEANYAFMECVESFNKDKDTKFTTWLYVSAWNRMQEFRRQTIQQHFREEYNLEEIAERDHFDIAKFMDKLSKDAAIAVTIALNPTSKMMKEIEKHRSQIVAHRTCVQMELHKLGWDSKRIRSAFKEVREVL